MSTLKNRHARAASEGAEAPSGAEPIRSAKLPMGQVEPTEPVYRRRRRRRSVWPALLLLAMLGGGGAGGWWWWQSRGKVAKIERAIYVVRRGDLLIVITEGGSVKALHSEVIKSQVEGKATIISLVPEGTRITDDDVKKGKILVEMDSADLRERLTQQEITFANAKASYTAAKEAYAIDKSEGESKIKNGEFNVKFGRMDLEHYVGQALCVDALAGKVDLLKVAEQLHDAAREHRHTVEAKTAAALKDIERTLAAPPDAKFDPRAPLGGGPKAEKPAARPNEEERLAGVTEPGVGDGRLGGAALQARRKLDADIELSIERFKRAADKLIWTARLEKKGFVSHNELEADELALKSSLIDLQQALSARELFLRYEFPKKAEEFLSIYTERGRELDRIKARARASLAQAEAKLKSNEATFRVQETRFGKLQKQVGFCTIRATKPGLVVYATSGDHWRSRTPIDEGTTVHERQEIIKLPDISALAVDVKVHESVVDKVKVGLGARIRIDAFPNLRLRGKVRKVGVLPDSQRWWLNPDLKQYQTEVSIEGSHDQFKPGMSAEVEILVGTRKGVLQVPVQAVSTRGGKTLVYVVRDGGEQAREVQLGEANDKFVEIRSGLSGGEAILLEAPQVVSAQDEKRDGEETPEAPGEPSDRPAPGQRPGVRPKAAPGTQPAGATRSPPKGTGKSPAGAKRKPREQK